MNKIHSNTSAALVNQQLVGNSGNLYTVTFFEPSKPPEHFFVFLKSILFALYGAKILGRQTYSTSCIEMQEQFFNIEDCFLSSSSWRKICGEA